MPSVLNLAEFCFVILCEPNSKLVDYIIKNGTVPLQEVTKFDFTIGFGVVNLSGNKVWFMDLLGFSEVEVEKYGVL